MAVVSYLHVLLQYIALWLHISWEPIYNNLIYRPFLFGLELKLNPERVQKERILELRLLLYLQVPGELDEAENGEGLGVP